MKITYSIFGTSIKNRNVQQHVSPYGRIDATDTGITAQEVSQAEAGSKHSISQIFISVPGGGDVKVKNLNDNIVTVKFTEGINPVPMKEVIKDDDNPTQVDIFY